MIPKRGDLVRINPEYIKAIRLIGDPSWHACENAEVEIIEVMNWGDKFKVRWQHKDDTYSVFLGNDGTFFYGRTNIKFFTSLVHNIQSDKCICNSPDITITGIGRLAFQVCRICKKEI